MSCVVLSAAQPLLASARTPDPIITRAKIQTIFSVVEVMTTLNKVLLEDLQKRLDAWHVDQVRRPARALCFALTPARRCWATSS